MKSSPRRRRCGKRRGRDAPLDTEALKGERVTIYDENEEGWAWGQLAADNYVGWLPLGALAAPGVPPTHKVAALRTFAFPGPSIKLPPVEAFPFGARLAVTRVEDRLAVTDSGFYVPAIHLQPVGDNEADFVAVGRALSRRALSVGRQDRSGPRLFGPSADRACGLRRLLSARYRYAGAGAGTGRRRFRSFCVQARRSDILEGPRRDRVRRREFASRQCLSHGGGDRADRGSRGPHPRRGQRSHQRAADREDIVELSMILSENRAPLFGIMLEAARWRPRRR